MSNSYDFNIAQGTSFVVYLNTTNSDGSPINLSSNFPINTLSNDVYELALFSSSTSTNSVTYEISLLNSGISITGMLTGTLGTVLPSPSTLLTYTQAVRYNNIQAKSVGLDIMSDYIETDY